MLACGISQAGVLTFNLFGFSRPVWKLKEYGLVEYLALFLLDYVLSPHLNSFL